MIFIVNLIKIFNLFTGYHDHMQKNIVIHNKDILRVIS